MRVGRSPLHLLHDSLFKGSVKAKKPDFEDHTKRWQDFEDMLTMWSTLFVR